MRVGLAGERHANARRNLLPWADAVATVRPLTEAMRTRTFRSHSVSTSQTIPGGRHVIGALRCIIVGLALLVAARPDRGLAAAVEYQMLHSFGFTNLIGRSPEAALTLASDGNLYGAARLGGRGNRGTIYRLKADGSGFLVIHNFYGTNGSPSEPSMTSAAGVLPFVP